MLIAQHSHTPAARVRCDMCFQVIRFMTSGSLISVETRYLCIVDSQTLNSNLQSFQSYAKNANIMHIVTVTLIHEYGHSNHIYHYETSKQRDTRATSKRHQSDIKTTIVVTAAILTLFKANKQRWRRGLRPRHLFCGFLCIGFG